MTTINCHHAPECFPYQTPWIDARHCLACQMSYSPGVDRVVCGDGLDVLTQLWGNTNRPRAACLFADPPDNIGLKYDTYHDNRDADEYGEWLRQMVVASVMSADTCWFSFNKRWTLEMSHAVAFVTAWINGLEFTPCVQVFTFGQHNSHDLGNNHRPLWRVRHKNTPVYPDQIRVPSWRQLNGDKRANPAGRVPGDVFDFPRVTGNSKQRRKWHKTQLNEGLVKRCVLLSTRPGDLVLDPFAGTGTTLRVCRELDRRCLTVEMDYGYCQKIKDENDGAYFVDCRELAETAGEETTQIVGTT